MTLVYLHYRTAWSSDFDAPGIESHDARHLSDEIPIVFSALAGAGNI